MKGISKIAAGICMTGLLASPVAAHAAPIQYNLTLDPPANASICGTVQLDPDSASVLTCTCPQRHNASADQCTISADPSKLTGSLSQIVLRPQNTSLGPHFEGLLVPLPSAVSAANAAAYIAVHLQVPDLDAAEPHTFAEFGTKKTVTDADVVMLFQLFNTVWGCFDETHGTDARSTHTADLKIAYQYLAYSRFIFSHQGWQINDRKDQLIQWMQADTQNLQSALVKADFSDWENNIVEFFPDEMHWTQMRWTYNYLSGKGWPNRSACTWPSAFADLTSRAFAAEPDAQKQAFGEMRIKPAELTTLERLCKAADGR